MHQDNFQLLLQCPFPLQDTSISYFLCKNCCQHKLVPSKLWTLIHVPVVGTEMLNKVVRTLPDILYLYGPVHPHDPTSSNDEPRIIIIIYHIQWKLFWLFKKVKLYLPETNFQCAPQCSISINSIRYKKTQSFNTCFFENVNIFHQD